MGILSRYALSSCVAAAMLAGCGGSQPPIGAPVAMPQSRAIAQRTARGASRGCWRTQRTAIFIILPTSTPSLSSTMRVNELEQWSS